MAIFKAFIASLLISLLLLQLVAADQLVTSAGKNKGTAPPKKIDCGGACAARCRLSSRPHLCKRACGTCCARCNCVPPGTAGNQEMCPCYASLTTHGGRRKNAQQILRHVNGSVHDGGALVLKGGNEWPDHILAYVSGILTTFCWSDILWNGHDNSQSGIFHQNKLQLNWLSPKDAVKEKFTVLDNVQWFEVLEATMAISNTLLATLLISLLLLLGFVESSSDPMVITNMVEQSFTDDKIDCDEACKERCKLSSRPNLCKRACGTCCDRCNCVPPGTSGNYDVCPCYRDMTTHGGKHKCP
ncbi:hypothetical protein CXB51_015749 [Gossypium anomalum]|uniref:Uncharacterized protein n=1 Tax=Gossypium anomalum TaxID=47600 RepID=A0A8J5YSU7_9ROSI|nr:hypothetical protein CXB51_015749 [Gossypium anomalum]